VQYPNYNVVYFFHHGSSFLFCASISAMHYVGHSELRNTLLRKVTNVFRQN
jgi:NO-binding membrane sensor protein with MHYT domain